MDVQQYSRPIFGKDKHIHAGEHNVAGCSWKYSKLLLLLKINHERPATGTVGEISSESILYSH